MLPWNAGFSFYIYPLEVTKNHSYQIVIFICMYYQIICQRKGLIYFFSFPETNTYNTLFSINFNRNLFFEIQIILLCIYV